jgi:glycosyltransferase involved in cell wall biosynthesis
VDRRSRQRGARAACARRPVANNLTSAAPGSRILLVTPTSPWAETFGSQQRTVLLYEALRKLADVDVLILSEGERDEASAPDRPEVVGTLSWREPRGMPYKYAINRFVSQWCDKHLDWRRYRLAVGRHFTTVTKIGWPRHVRTIADCDDIVYRYVPRHDAPLWRMLAAARGNLRTWQTRASLGRYDHAFLSCQRDRNLFGARRTSLLPNVPVGVESLRETPDEVQDRILIVGSLWYAPNRNGIEWFLEKCWPTIAARCPRLTLRLVGAAPPELRERWARNVRTSVAGFAKDLRAEYARALFAVVPIHYGGGTCIKFVEAAAYGKASVITPFVSSGYETDFHDDDAVLVGIDAADMARKCIALAENRQLRERIAASAQRIARERYTAEHFTAAVHAAAVPLLC